MSDESPAGYAGLWLPPERDPRPNRSTPDGELATYRDYLRQYRLTLELKCQDLTPEQLATASVPPSNLSLLGLVRHMAAVEDGWFVRVLQGQWDRPRMYRSESDHDLDFNGAAGTEECRDDAFATWHRVITNAETWLGTRSDDSLGERVRLPDGGESASVRDILVHLIEEYARHCGHADLLRECIDGRTGL
ncbi:DinB family protein [Microlunatus elymi]|uniref:DinB family protein n=1 Tax=Microlunatus elymi TaxID=2596828 RepID=A0A516PVI2_9ACTN|nr:DinB family protein [Microlunatus elymi]QDP95195.1 DinB family protein [Microlunatus elymi]